MKEEKIYCDFCGKELWNSIQSSCISVVIQTVQGVRDEVYEMANRFDGWKENNGFPHWKHRQSYGYVICEECCGEKIKINHGDDAAFSLSNFGKTLLKKLGLVKP